MKISGKQLSDTLRSSTNAFTNVHSNKLTTTSIESVSNNNIELAPNGTGSTVIKGNGTSGSGHIVLNCEDNSHGITLKGPPHSAGATYTLTLPNTNGNADEVLKTDGSGNLDWVAQGVGYTTASSDVSATSFQAVNYQIPFDISSNITINLPDTVNNYTQAIANNGKEFIIDNRSTLSHTIRVANGSQHVSGQGTYQTFLRHSGNYDATGIISTTGAITLKIAPMSRMSINIDTHITSSVFRVVYSATSTGGMIGSYTYNHITSTQDVLMNNVYLCEGTFTLTLPSHTTTEEGERIEFKNVGTGTISIYTGFSTSNIDVGFNSTKTLASGESATFVKAYYLGASNQAVQWTTIDGTAPTKLAIASNLSDLASDATARTNLGVAIGSDVQAYDAQLTDIASLATTDSGFIVGNGSTFVLESGATVRTSLGLGDVATLDVGTSANNVVQLDSNAKLPAVDGSQLINLPSGGGASAPSVTTDSSGTDTTITTNSGIEEIHLISNGTNNVTITIPGATPLGYKYNIKRLGTGTVTIQASSGTIDTAATFSIASQFDSLTVVSDATNYHII